MSRTYVAAVVGCGKGGGIHLTSYRRSPRFRLQAVCDLRPEAIEKQIGIQPDLHAYTDFREMLSKEQIDFLSVATLPPTHEEVALAGVKAGVKAILCEKPMAHDVFSAQRILDACMRSGVALAVTHQARLLPHAREVRELYQTGEICEAYLCEMRVRGFDLGSAGVHMINLVAFILGDPQVSFVMGQMDSSTRAVRDGMQVETAGLTFYQFRTGVRCILETGEVEFPANRPNGITLYGALGRVDFDLWKPEFRLWSRKFPDGLQRCPEPRPGDHTREKYGHEIMAEGLVAQLESGKLNYENARQGLAAVEVVFASYLSSGLSRKIPVPVPDDMRLDSTRTWAGLPVRAEAHG